MNSLLTERSYYHGESEKSFGASGSLGDVGLILASQVVVSGHRWADFFAPHWEHITYQTIVTYAVRACQGKTRGNQSGVVWFSNTKSCSCWFLSFLFVFLAIFLYERILFIVLTSPVSFFVLINLLL